MQGWHDIVFSEESLFCLQHHDGCIHVGSIMENESCQHSFNIIIFSITKNDAMGCHGYTVQSPLDCIGGILNSVHYIPVVLRSVAVPFIRTLQITTYHQDNARYMLSVLCRHYLIQKMFNCYFCLHVFQTSHK